MADRWVTLLGPDHVVIDVSGLNKQCYSFLMASYLCWMKQTSECCWIKHQTPTEATVYFRRNPTCHNPKIPVNIFTHAFWILFRCHKCFRHQVPMLTANERQKLQSPVLDETRKSFTGKCIQCQSDFTRNTADCFPNEMVLLHWIDTFNSETPKEQKHDKVEMRSNTPRLLQIKSNKIVFPLPLPTLYMQTDNHDYSISFTSEQQKNESSIRVFCDQCETYCCGHGLDDWRPKPVSLNHFGPKPFGLNHVGPKSNIQTRDIETFNNIETFGKMFLKDLPQLEEDIKLQEPNDLIWKTNFDSKQKAMMHALCSQMNLEQESQFIMNGLVYFLRVESIGAGDVSSTIQSIVSTLLEQIQHYFLKSRVHRCHMFRAMMTWSARNKMRTDWKPLQHVFESILSICGSEGILTGQHVLDWFEWDKKQMPHRLAHHRVDAATWFSDEIGCGSFLELLKNSTNRDHKRQKREEKETTNEIGQEKEEIKREESIPEILSFLPFRRKSKRKREESDTEAMNVNCMHIQSKYAKPNNEEDLDIYESAEIQKYQFSSDTEEDNGSSEDNAYTLAQRIKETRKENKRKRLVEGPDDEPDTDC